MSLSILICGSAMAPGMISVVGQDELRRYPHAPARNRGRTVYLGIKIALNRE